VSAADKRAVPGFVNCTPRIEEPRFVSAWVDHGPHATVYLGGATLFFRSSQEARDVERACARAAEALEVLEAAAVASKTASGSGTSRQQYKTAVPNRQYETAVAKPEIVEKGGYSPRPAVYDLRNLPNAPMDSPLGTPVVQAAALPSDGGEAHA